MDLVTSGVVLLAMLALLAAAEISAAITRRRRIADTRPTGRRPAAAVIPRSARRRS